MFKAKNLLKKVDGYTNKVWHKKSIAELKSLNTCKLCFKLMGRAKMLPCGHEHCHTCTWRLIQEKRCCPKCSDEINAKCLNELPVSETVDTLATLLKIESNSEECPCKACVLPRDQANRKAYTFLDFSNYAGDFGRRCIDSKEKCPLTKLFYGFFSVANEFLKKYNINPQFVPDKDCNFSPKTQLVKHLLCAINRACLCGTTIKLQVKDFPKCTCSEENHFFEVITWRANLMYRILECLSFEVFLSEVLPEFVKVDDFLSKNVLDENGKFDLNSKIIKDLSTVVNDFHNSTGQELGYASEFPHNFSEDPTCLPNWTDLKSLCVKKN